MTFLGWLCVLVLFAVGMAGAIYPILPGALAIYAAFFVYGLFFGFESFGFWFWSIQTLIVVMLFVADYVVNAWGVKRYGGSRASVVGSTIGIIIGPFLIPAFGLVLGPFLGAFLGEIFTGADVEKAMKSSWGAVVGLFSSIAVKIVLQIVMIVLFFTWVFMF
ncbi:DUF456 family protein [Paenibacillus thiaminolyticus]|uniref:DUF456 domain-containing protein n=1 Tax=Paenibacillus thiaminolyticus TaxID=49283 RepID=UPI00232ED9B9|nr:DUF456 family protein [Paenibacillus thiaminolyticus]WCF09523.1 DUF456 family protein [Paenibacillus thiaminolyticus]WII38740.1 DUF456 family protein [Paenibacillus thiaminolyticus]